MVRVPVSELTENAMKKFRESSGGDEDGNSAGAAGGKKSFLVKLAMALGKVIDAKMERAVEIGEQIDKASQAEKPQTASLSAEMNAVGQEIGLISNALNNVIKTIGEAGSTLARKQG